MDRLRLAEDLLAALGSADIAYVHWKSNEHLDASLRGETDLDLLIRPADEGNLDSVARRLRFVSMVTPRDRRVPGAEARLGCDPETGSLLHLDVAYQLHVGERLLKNHTLPIEDWLLADPVSLYDVPTPAPEKELIVLYIRSLLKIAWRQLIRSRVRGDSPFPSRIRAEFSWVVERVDKSRLSEAVSASGLPVTESELKDFCERVEAGRLDLAYVGRQRRSVRRRLSKYERLPRYVSVPKKAWLRLRTTSLVIRLGLGIPSRTVAPRGAVVAVVGADGSGKSRLAQDLDQWLGAKLAVDHLYFGQPKSGFLFKVLNKPGSLARRGDGRALAHIARYTDPLKWMMLARRRRQMASKARTDATRGTVVIAERFPVEELQTMEAPMDGPRLQSDPECPPSWAMYEQRQYDSIVPPDLFIVLDADLATLRARKLDLEEDEHRAKVDAVNALEPGPGRAILDATEPYDRVLLAAKTAVWGALSGAEATVEGHM